MTGLKLCQSCGMPLTSECFGTQADGAPSPDYCVYCYEKGDFTADLTMEEMINSCVPFMISAHPELSTDKARAMMRAILPGLKRWREEKK